MADATICCPKPRGHPPAGGTNRSARRIAATEPGRRKRHRAAHQGRERRLAALAGNTSWVTGDPVRRRMVRPHRLPPGAGTSLRRAGAGGAPGPVWPFLAHEPNQAFSWRRPYLAWFFRRAGRDRGRRRRRPACRAVPAWDCSLFFVRFRPPGRRADRLRGDPPSFVTAPLGHRRGRPRSQRIHGSHRDKGSPYRSGLPGLSMRPLVPGREQDGRGCGRRSAAGSAGRSMSLRAGGMDTQVTAWRTKSFAAWVMLQVGRASRARRVSAGVVSGRKHGGPRAVGRSMAACLWRPRTLLPVYHHIRLVEPADHLRGCPRKTPWRSASLPRRSRTPSRASTV